MTQESGSRVSLTRIAARLGVSAKTVSNAYNRPDQLSPALRARILATAEDMGFSGPDPLARAFRQGRSGLLGVLYANRLSYAFADAAAVSFLCGFSEIIEPTGNGLVMIPGSASDHSASGGLAHTMIDGVVVYSLATDDPVLDVLRRRNLPYVTVDQPRLAGVPWVGIDDGTGASAIASHLVELGHRRIGLVSFGLNRSPDGASFDLFHPPPITFEVTARRLDGVARILRQVPGVDAVPAIHMRDSTELEGETGVVQLLTDHRDLTAVICLSDRLALGAIAGIRGLGLRVPEDISITGFDDTPLAPLSDPPLTSVAQPHADKGTIAASMLLGMLGQETADPERLLPHRLVMRSSTAPRRR